MQFAMITMMKTIPLRRGATACYWQQGIIYNFVKQNKARERERNSNINLSERKINIYEFDSCIIVSNQSKMGFRDNFISMSMHLQFYFQLINVCAYSKRYAIILLLTFWNAFHGSPNIHSHWNIENVNKHYHYQMYTHVMAQTSSFK